MGKSVTGATTTLGLKFDAFPINVIVEKYFFLSFELVKSNFTTVGPLEQCFGRHLEKSITGLPVKNPSDSHDIAL